MKKKMLSHRCVSLLLSCILLGCSIPSLKKYTQSWIGHSIEDKRKGAEAPNAYDNYFKSIGREKGTTYKLENGNWVYVELDSRDCFIHWEVNPDGIIVGYRLEGCKGR